MNLTASAEAVASTLDVRDVLVVAAALVLAAIFARALAAVWISTALLLTLAGIALGPAGTGWFEAELDSSTVHLIAGLALATALFSDAATTDLRLLRGAAGEPVRLLTIGLVGSIVLGMLLAIPLFPALGVPLALAVGTMLAPTDAALGAPVVSDPQVPARIRRVLTIESGLNDGLAVPILLLALGWAGLEDSGDTGFIGLLINVLGLGALVGAGIALVVAALWIPTMRRWGASPAWSPLVPLVTAVFCYLLAEHLGASGFIAAFVGGLAFGAATRDRIDDELLVDETVSNLLQGVVWFVFGAVAVGPVLLDGGLDWRWAAYALCSLTLVRLVPVWLALLGTGERPPTVAFIGWFGPRGLASVVFLLTVIDLSPPADASTTIVGVVTTTVLLSIIAHGVSARPGAAAYARWATSGTPVATRGSTR